MPVCLRILSAPNLKVQKLSEFQVSKEKKCDGKMLLMTKMYFRMFEVWPNRKRGHKRCQYAGCRYLLTNTHNSAHQSVKIFA